MNQIDPEPQGNDMLSNKKLPVPDTKFMKWKAEMNKECPMCWLECNLITEGAKNCRLATIQAVH